MGQYWTLSIKGFSVLEGKNSFDGAMLQLFRQGDANIERMNAPDGERSYKSYKYACTVAEMRERLDLMGFNAEQTVEHFEEGRKRELQGLGGVDSEYSRFLEAYSFENWLATMRPLVQSSREVFLHSRYPHVGSMKEFICSYDNDNALLGFFTSEPRFVLRGCLEAANSRAFVKLNLKDLINGGYLDDDPSIYDVFSEAALEYARTSPVIILTEGTSDRWVLESTLPLVYPHLVGFFSFMDFESSNSQGGAGQLVTTVKAFVGSKIRNRILAVFDNDTAAQVALQGLEGIVMPSNIRCCRLPVLRSARRYPSDGPSGRHLADINGKACSIELFFGPDVLGRGGKRSIVRWSGFDTSTRQYQGEVDSKRVLQDRFRTKLRSATRSNVKNDPAWGDIRALWAYLKSQSQAICLDIVRAADRAR